MSSAAENTGSSSPEKPANPSEADESDGQHQISEESAAPDTKPRISVKDLGNSQKEENEAGKVFSGQIVYNPDGSAYIVEEEELLSQIPRQEGSIIDSLNSNSTKVDFPRIEQAVYIARKHAWYNAVGNAYLRMLKENCGDGSAPEVHSFKVFSIKEQLTRNDEMEVQEISEESCPQKPILMCFLCKLSFTLSRPFLNHCEAEHSLQISTEERSLFSTTNARSAILQCVGVDKTPLLSVLEPMNKEHTSKLDASTESAGGGEAADKPALIPSLAGLLDTIRTNIPDPSSYLSVISNLNNPNLTPTNASQLQGTTIGPCPDHVNGRQPGIECEKCDFILNASRTNDPSSSWGQQPRGLFKTLKCPKCNWHYKYQETLEVHMKEKHPDSENSCIYCITGQQHPRLARGETYTCGYKPYRCEVCNYSTTTKGNLSIHMQSDKHINNMQELQNGGVITAPDGTKITQAALAQMPLAQRLNATHPFPMQNWRCDLCNYETNLPRNLRIHLTSEKHVQNMACMSEKMKHFHNFQFLQSLAGNKPDMPNGFPMNPMASTDMFPDLPQNPALLLQLLKNGQSALPSLEGMIPDNSEPPAEPTEPNPCFLFNCCICREFSTNSIEALSSHINLDRSGESDAEVSVVINGIHLCKLCTYKTNLKANFQLHLKTDKHLARLSLLNHIREGGPGNEWKLKFLLGTNPIQIRCNACDFYTNSMHKLQVHIQTQAHEVSLILFHHLVSSETKLLESEGRSGDQDDGEPMDTNMEGDISTERKRKEVVFTCVLCKFTCKGKSFLLHHARTLSHLRAEQFGELRRLSEGGEKGDQPDVADIFTVELTEANEKKDDDGDSPAADRNESDKSGGVCPLCQETFGDDQALEDHAQQVHQLTRAGIDTLTSMAEGCNLLNKARMEANLRTPPKGSEPESEVDTKDSRCSPIGAISEKHVYKYRCSHCSLAFKTKEKLELHAKYHQIRDTTKCKLCDRSFRTVLALIKHLETGHQEADKEDIEQYKVTLLSSQLALTGQLHDRARENEDDFPPEKDREGDEQNNLAEPLNNAKVTQKFDKTYSYSLDKYLDPKRPFKCDVCKESFTQKNILLVHFNSVSHLHKTKKVLKEQQENNPNSLTPRSERGSPTSPSTPGSTLMSVLGSLNAKKQLEPDTEHKPYKCNICKVSYAQGSTLDIHVRSVLHHTRASKLQELVISGHVDLSKPLIENPDNDDAQQAGLDLFSPQSMNSNSPQNKTPSQGSDSPTPGPLCSTPKSLAEVFEKVGEESTKEEFANLISSINQTDKAGVPCSNSDTNSSGSLTDGKKSSQMLKSLLQNYGFELVMQFNESHQRRKMEQERLRNSQEASKEEINQNQEKEDAKEEKNTSEEETGDKLEKKNPEIKKSKCPLCDKQFSSIWVLKAHTEEDHKVVVPQEFVQKYVDELKSNADEDDEKSGEIDNKTKELQSNDLPPNVKGNDEAKTNDESAVQPKEEMNAFQQVFKAFKEQEAMLIKNSKLQNMNLYPPLIPGMLPMGMIPGGKFPDQNATSQFENQIFSKLGIDPDIVRQAGLDPKLLIHLAMMDPKAGLDPKMLAMFTSPPKDKEFPNPKLMQLALESKLGMLPNPPLGFPAPEMFQMNAQNFDSSKRARTRITDDQLKILRANFDINNSPSEEQINSLSLKTSLPPKVIKHWFRNTLFKERQRNKDSPYNFNNPPSTVLNLEEYEKTGEPKVTPIKPEEQKQAVGDDKPAAGTEMDDQEEAQNPPESESEKSDMDDSGAMEIKKENDASKDEELGKIEEFRKLQMSLALRVSVSPDTGNSSNGKSFDGIFSPQMNIGDRHPLLQSPLPPGFPNPLGFLPGPLGPNFFNGFGGFRNASPLGDGFNQSASAKRANRTRFTDYQIKVLQEFFENNAYPKDDDLEYLSKLLGLSPRVIVVWFQNARQKARKIYENQPPIDPEDEGAGRFTRTPGLNYQCKKCLLVFQRYYELIRHQKQHCFKEEDAKRSALAQRAAAQAAAQFVGQNSIGLGSMVLKSEAENGPVLQDQSLASPMSSNEGHSPFDNSSSAGNSVVSPLQKFMEENKNIGTIFEKRNQEDRVMKYLNEAQINLMSRYPANSHLAFLQKQGMSEPQEEQNLDSFFANFGHKRKLSGETDDYERDENGQPKDKRLRTTILPEQLDYLYQKYQLESNPSRKMLEQIAAEVGLRKRVVQVWFQNTRARERKGQFRAHQQVINKRCPFCPALFKVRSALESHLVTKHASQYSRGEINIDNLPDAGVEEPQVTMAGRSTLFPSVPCPMSPTNLPSLVPNQDKSSEFEASMRKYYEETMKQFISDVKLNQQNSDRQPSNNIQEKNNEAALDLSSPPLRNEDSKQDDGKNLGDDRDKQFSPAATGTDSQIYEFEEDGMTMTSTYPFDAQNVESRKKFRTQLSNTQVKMMRAVFELYKMPVMAECQILADFIGLQKRVVQVWFQNARAKEKKVRLQMEQGGEEGGEPASEPVDQCQFCRCQYENKYKVQEHLFDRKHLENVRMAIENGKYEPENPGASLADKSKASNFSSPRSEPGNKPFNFPEARQVNSAQEKQTNHFVNDQSTYGQHQQHYRTDQQNFTFQQNHSSYRQGTPFNSQEFPSPPGYCQNQMVYPGGYPQFPPGYAGGYNQGYNNVMAGYPYQSGVPN